MDISAILPFTEDKSEPLFVEQSEKLRLGGNQLSEDELFRIYLEAREDIIHAIRITRGFWVKFLESDVIDVTKPAQNFYNILFARVGLSVDRMSVETANRAFRLLCMGTEGHEFVAQATNSFLNAMVQDLKIPDPLLAYALV